LVPVFILCLYHGEHVYEVKCEVAESNGPVILGPKQALKMNYVQFLAITKPVISTAPAFMKKTSSVPAVAVAPVIKQTTSNNITINDKTHHIPTSKEYLLKEYKDVFEGIGTLPGGPYHIQLKGDYKAVEFKDSISGRATTITKFWCYCRGQGAYRVDKFRCSCKET